jgi:formamidopyrimidine-DNA glycosylase
LTNADHPVARIVHFLRLHLVGKTIKHVESIEDNSVFGKAGTTGPEVVAALTGKKVLAAGSQGKYFWSVALTSDISSMLTDQG